MSDENSIVELDPRLVEACAACLCWAEWPSVADRTDDPWSYWQSIHPDERQKYMQNARVIASALRSDKEFAIVPARATNTMREAAIEAGRGLRSHAGAAHVFEEMVAAGRRSIGWRQP